MLPRSTNTDMTQGKESNTNTNTENRHPCQPSVERGLNRLYVEETVWSWGGISTRNSTTYPHTGLNLVRLI